MANRFPKKSASKTPPSGFDWNDLKYFLAVVRSGGLSAAAAQLKTSASTVSRHIEQLEQRLRSTLFIRQQTGYVLTEEGRHLLLQTEAVENSLLSVQRRSDQSRLNEPLTGKIRLATAEGLAAFLIAPNLVEFRQHHPLVQVELVSSLTLADLNRREADIALRFVREDQYNVSGDHIAVPAGEVEFNLYVARKLASGSTTSLRALIETLPFIAWIDDDQKLPMTEWLNELFGSRPALFASNSLIAQYEAARVGLGIALLPDYLVDNDTQLRKLDRLEIPTRRTLWIVYHRDMKNSRLIIAMRDFLKQLLMKYRKKNH
jgi:DNA-binding transcriptional LysR family regulator